MFLGKSQHYAPVHNKRKEFWNSTKIRKLPKTTRFQDLRVFAFFPTCQVRVVRFYVSCLLLLSSHLLSSSSCSTATLDHSGLCRTSTTTILLSVPCRTSTTTITASVPCRTSTTTITTSVPCRTSTAGIPAQCSLPDLNREYPRPVFPAGPQPQPSTPSVPCRTSTASIHAKRYAT